MEIVSCNEMKRNSEALCFSFAFRRFGFLSSSSSTSPRVAFSGDFNVCERSDKGKVPRYMG